MLMRSLSQLSLRELSRRLVAALVLTGFAISLGCGLIFKNVKDAVAHAYALQLVSDPQRAALNELQIALGMGGMIHRFHDYIVRADAIYHQSTGWHIRDAREAIQKLVTAELKHDQDLEQLRAQLDFYESYLDEVFSALAQKNAAREIFSSIRADDSRALIALREIEARISSKDEGSKGAVLGELISALGYGGMIHGVRSMLFSANAQHKERALAGLERARDALNKYRDLSLTEAELSALDTIGAEFDALLATMDDLEAGHASGQDVLMLDVLTYRDDKEFTAAITFLQSAILAENLATARTLKALLSQTVKWTAGLALFVGLLSCFLAIIVSRTLKVGVVSPAHALSHEISRLADGDTTAKFDQFAGATEIGGIARSAESFRELLLRNLDLAQTAERHANEQKKLAQEHRRLFEEQRDLRAQQAKEEMSAAANRIESDDLQKRLSAVAARADKGDYSGRIDCKYQNQEISGLGMRFDKIMSSVCDTIAAVDFATQRIAEGDLRARMEGNFQGALEELQTSFNEAISGIALMVAEVLRNAVNIDDDAERIEDVSHGLEVGVERQNQSIALTAEAVSEMRRSVDLVHERADHAQRIARTATKVAERSAATVTASVEAIERIIQESTKITVASDLIDEIAFETNILALNAGVEAARAGESGRGFAVVASEVRGLALRSAEAARNISQMIENNEREIAKGAELITSAGHAIGEITGHTQSLGEAVFTVSEVSADQFKALEKVNHSVAELRKLTDENSSATTEAIDAAANLRKSSGALRESGCRFRIDENDQGSEPKQSPMPRTKSAS